MEPLNLEAIKARAEAATEGPWESWCDEDVDNATFCIAAADSDSAHAFAPTEEDAEFIAHAREDVPVLVAEVERLRQAHTGGVAELLEGLAVAMMGTTDGDLIDRNSEVPVGEMYHLAAEYLTAQLSRPTPSDEELLATYSKSYGGGAQRFGPDHVRALRAVAALTTPEGQK